MKFLMVGRSTRHSYLLNEIKKEGHEVKFLAGKPDPQHNLVEYLETPSQALEWKPDVVIFVEPGFGELSRVFQGRKIKTFGGSLILDSLHSDKEYLSVLGARAKVPIFPLENPTAPTLRMAGCFSGKGLLHPVLAYGVDDDLLPGIKSHEALTLVALDPECRLVQETMKPLELVLNAFNANGWFFLEVHLVERYPGSIDFVPHIHNVSVEIPDGFLPAFCSGLQQNISDFYLGASSGKRFCAKFSEEPTCAVKVSIPPYPNVDWPWLSLEDRLSLQAKMLEGCKGILVEDYPGERTQYLLSVTRNGTGKTYHTIGPEVCYVTAQSDFQGLPYVVAATIAETKIPNAIYRPHIGAELVEALSRFEDHGLLVKSSEVREWLGKARKREKVEVAASGYGANTGE